MGVDYYACEHCGETFPDCGDYARCEHGHMIGPCCFHLIEWDDDSAIVDDSDYGVDTVTEKFCPVCKAGGSTEQQLAKANDEIARLNAIIAELTAKLENMK